LLSIGIVVELEGSALLQKYQTNQKVELVERIVARCRFVAQMEDPDVRSIKLHEAAYGNRLDLVMNLLRDPEVDVNACDQFGRTALICGASSGNIDCVLVMLQSKLIGVYSWTDRQTERERECVCVCVCVSVCVGVRDTRKYVNSHD
jgi:hypothetical protein